MNTGTRRTFRANIRFSRYEGFCDLNFQNEKSGNKLLLCYSYINYSSFKENDPITVQ
jgi:hypothetical protein